jgi:hypothetical protein
MGVLDGGLTAPFYSHPSPSFRFSCDPPPLPCLIMSGSRLRNSYSFAEYKKFYYLKNRRQEKLPNLATGYGLHRNHRPYGAYISGNTSEPCVDLATSMTPCQTHLHVHLCPRVRPPLRGEVHERYFRSGTIESRKDSPLD